MKPGLSSPLFITRSIGPTFYSSSRRRAVLLDYLRSHSTFTTATPILRVGPYNPEPVSSYCCQTIEPAIYNEPDRPIMPFFYKFS